MLITPSATPYATMRPEMIAAMPLDGDGGVWSGPLKPSTEWRFHLGTSCCSRPDVGAVVHAHPAVLHHAGGGEARASRPATT